MARWSMAWIAVSMLLGDRVKYIGLVLGVAFSTLLMVQQSSIFVGVLRLSAYLVHANPQIDIWVSRPGSGGTEIVEHMPESWLNRVRGVEGVAWALPMYRSSTTARGADGLLKIIGIVGIDEATLIGGPGVMLSGSLEDLRGPDTAIADISTFKRLFGDLPITERPTIEIGRRRITIVGVCRAVRTITGGEVIFARQSVAVRIAQEPNFTVTFGMVKVADGHDHRAVAERIADATGLLADTRDQFRRRIVQWTIENTGLVQVLGSVILLAVGIGVLVVGQTFYLFAYENQRYFAALKAMGASNLAVTGMLCLQAGIVSLLGFGLGLGASAAILELNNNDLSPMRGLTIEPPVMIAAGVLMPTIVMLTAVLGSRRVLTAEPGIVFR